MFDLPASTLRYYEDAGILTNVGSDENNQRMYKEEHVHIQKKLRFYSDIREALQTHKDKPCGEDYK